LTKQHQLSCKLQWRHDSAHKSSDKKPRCRSH